MARRGKLVVLDGSDGTGKTTQVALLAARLKRTGMPVATMHFPNYDANFFGEFIGECLTGAHGNFAKLDPYITSVLYAADRFESKKRIEQWLAQGKTVILDRYVSANQLHQGGKITDARARTRFLKWLDKMEHEVFGLPRPDLIMYLDMPLELSLQLLVSKAKDDAVEARRYLKKGQKDRVEQDKQYLRQAQEAALRFIRGKARWCRVVSAERGQVLSREVVHERVYTCVQERLGL